jgi:hypothetical protein
MKLLTKQDLAASNAVNAAAILQLLLSEDDGTVQIDLGNNLRAGMQLVQTSDQMDANAYTALDDWIFYDFMLNEEEKTIIIDEDTTGDYDYDSIEDVIEYRLNKIIDLIE